MHKLLAVLSRIGILKDAGSSVNIVRKAAFLHNKMEMELKHLDYNLLSRLVEERIGPWVQPTDLQRICASQTILHSLVELELLVIFVSFCSIELWSDTSKVWLDENFSEKKTEDMI